MSTYPEIAGGESVTGRNSGTRARMSIICVYVRQQGGHYRWHTRAQVFRGEAVKMPGKKFEKTRLLMKLDNIMILTLSSFRWYRNVFRTFACISSKIRNTFVYDKQNSSFTSMPNMYCSLEKRTSIPKIKCKLRCFSRLKVNLFIRQGREN